MKENKLESLEALPEFARSPFDGKTNVPVFEVARVTLKTTPHTVVPYNLQKFVYIVGRSPDSKIIYYSLDAMLREDGKALADHGDCAGEIMRDTIERYEPFVSNDSLFEVMAKRRI